MDDKKKNKEITIADLKKAHKRSFEICVEVLEGGKLPCKAHLSDAGFDLYATDDIVLKQGDVIKHPLNIKLQLPVGTYGEITTKSGLGLKGMLVYAGIIDQNYRGIPHVIASCLKCNTEIKIRKGEKIAQMIMHPYNTNFYITKVDSVDADTDRGEGGFGSSGK